MLEEWNAQFFIHFGKKPLPGFGESAVCTEVILPTDWPSGVNTKTISNPAFIFRRKDWRDGSKLILQYEYQSLADSVSPDLVGEYIGRLDEISKSLGYELIWR